MMRKLAFFMKHKRISIFVYLLLIVVLGLMISVELTGNHRSPIPTYVKQQFDSKFAEQPAISRSVGYVPETSSETAQ